MRRRALLQILPSRLVFPNVQIQAGCQYAAAKALTTKQHTQLEHGAGHCRGMVYAAGIDVLLDGMSNVALRDRMDRCAHHAGAKAGTVWVLHTADHIGVKHAVYRLTRQGT